MTFRQAIPLFLLLLLPPALRGQSMTYQGHGLCHFILQNYNLPGENEDKINFIVSDLLKRHAEAFDFSANPDLHVRIRIFGKFDDFKRYAETNLSSGTEHETLAVSNLAGYFSVRNSEVVTWPQRDPTYLANNILHECSHAIMHQQFRVLPIWLDEGCAVYFSFPVFMRSEHADERLRYQWYILKKWLDDGSLPKLGEFINLTPREFRAQDPAKTYPVSWSIFQFLMSTPERRAAMNKMLREFQYPFTGECGALMNQAYPGGLKKMEAEWHAWIVRGSASVLTPQQH